MRPAFFLVTPRVTDAAAFRPLVGGSGGGGRRRLRAACAPPGATRATPRPSCGPWAPVAQARGRGRGWRRATPGWRRASTSTASTLDVGAEAGAGSPLAEALAALQPKKIVGAGGPAGRDAAMQAGEAGADYVMFGFPGGPDDPDAVLDMVGW